MPALSLRDRRLAPDAAATSLSRSALLVWALFFGGGDSSCPARVDRRRGRARGVARRGDVRRALVRPRLGRAGAAASACLTALVIWQGDSIVWSVQPDRSWDYVNRGLVYLAFLALGVFVGALVPRATRVVAAGLAALLALVLGYALLAKGIPALYPTTGGSRASARRSASGTRSRCSATSRSCSGCGARLSAGSTARCSSSAAS